MRLIELIPVFLLVGIYGWLRIERRRVREFRCSVLAGPPDL